MSSEAGIRVPRGYNSLRGCIYPEQRFPAKAGLCAVKRPVGRFRAVASVAWQACLLVGCVDLYITFHCLRALVSALTLSVLSARGPTSRPPYKTCLPRGRLPCRPPACYGTVQQHPCGSARGPAPRPPCRRSASSPTFDSKCSASMAVRAALAQRVLCRSAFSVPASLGR